LSSFCINISLIVKIIITAIKPMCYKKMMKLHLISSPGTTPWYSSIQTGCLKAYIDEKFKNAETIKTKSYPAHLSIPLRAFHSSYEDFHLKHEHKHELLWFYLVMKNFITGHKKQPLNELFSEIKKHTGTKDLKKILLDLEKAAKSFVDHELEPELETRALNLVGFSINSEQLYSSIFCALYLKQEYPDHKVLFIFGGGQIAFPRVINLLRLFKLDSLIVVAEGELKLEKIVSICLHHNKSQPEKLLGLCDRSMPGIYRTSTLKEDEVFSIKASELSQLTSVEGLPLPDYHDYFQMLKRYSDNDSIYNQLKDRVFILFDGSRGCTYAKCDFCGLNIS